MTQSIEMLLDGLNRVAKLEIDTGAAATVEEAVSRLRGYGVNIVTGPEVCESTNHQAALLTAVNIMRRFALGGVCVSGVLGADLLVPLPPAASLGAAIQVLGGRLGPLDPKLPTVAIGTTDIVSERQVTATFQGWRGGSVPADHRRLAETEATMPAVVLAASLASAEVFAMLTRDVQAGRRSVGLSLLRPDGEIDWLGSAKESALPTALPDDLWVLGLGHLGQAFLWTLALCPYREPNRVRLVLQDTDVTTGSTDSTSILTQPAMIGRKKTRCVAEVLERRGFTTSIIERPFDGGFRRRSEDDPAVLVCGVDNAIARASLEEPGFPMVVEAGLGRRAADFRAVRLHTFPASRRATNLWTHREESAPRPDLRQPSYRRLAQEGIDDCGLTRLADTAVGAPFVGGVAGALLMAQILRLLAGDLPDEVVDLDLRAPRARRAIQNVFIAPFNPGYQLMQPGKRSASSLSRA
jgi:hypothetical protein